MKTIVLSYALLSSFALHAMGFEGCGLYHFKGVLKEKKEAAFRVLYVVNENTQSQMTFDFANQDEVLKLTSLINDPTSFDAKILKKMDGTKGVITEISQIDKRFPNPLVPFDTGIKLINSLKCN